MSNSRSSRSADGLLYGCRSWLYLMLNFGLGITYFSALITGFALGFSLAIIWIGIPILALMFLFSRQLAAFDRWLAKSMIGLDAPPLDDDLGYKGMNPMRYVGANFTSASTWQRIVYLFLKFPLGIVSSMIGWMVFPFFLLEAFVNIIGLNTGMITGQMLRAMATGLSGINAGMLVSTPVQEAPRTVNIEKHKRAVYVEEDYDYTPDEVVDTESTEDEALHMARPVSRKRREKTSRLDVDDSGATEYYLDSDGEIRARRRN